MQAATRIDLSRTPLPLPIPQAQLFMVTLTLKGNTVRPRTLDFLLEEGCARQLWRLHKHKRLDTRFALMTTARRIVFMAVEELRFDLVDDPAAQTFTVAQIARIAKFNL